MRRGILGGTFDPPHLAHLIAGEAALRELDLDVVSFIPAGSPWQKDGTGVTDPSHRWEMVVRAVEGVSYFEADRREVDRDGWTYTIDTLETFPADEELVLVLGADAAAGLPTWHRVDHVVARARLAVMPRPGIERRTVETLAGPHHWLDVPELAVSGSLLRRLRAEGRSIRFYVREAVHAYIEANGLYAA